MKRILLIVLLVHFGESFRNGVLFFPISEIVGIPTIGAAYFFYFVEPSRNTVLVGAWKTHWQA